MVCILKISVSFPLKYSWRQLMIAPKNHFETNGMCPSLKRGPGSFHEPPEADKTWLRNELWPMFWVLVGGSGY